MKKLHLRGRSDIDSKLSHTSIVDDYQFSNPMLMPRQTSSLRLAKCIDRKIKLRETKNIRKSTDKKLSHIFQNKSLKTIKKVAQIRRDIKFHNTIEKPIRWHKSHRSINMHSISQNFREKKPKCSATLSKIKPNCTSCFIYSESKNKFDLSKSSVNSRNEKDSLISIKNKEASISRYFKRSELKKRNTQKVSDILCFCVFDASSLNARALVSETSLNSKNTCDQLLQTSEDCFLDMREIEDSFILSNESGQFMNSYDCGDYGDSDEILTNASSLSNTQFKMLPRIVINSKPKKTFD